MTTKSKNGKVGSTVDVHIKLVPDSLWKQVKALAALEGITLHALVIETLESRLKKATK